jgi:hypothetical protein
MTTSSQHRSSQCLLLLPSQLLMLLQQQLQRVHQAQAKQGAAGWPVRLHLLGHLR